MYGTVARLRIKPGVEQKLMQIGRRRDIREIPGGLWQAIYRLDDKPNEYLLAVGFESKEAYEANASSPEQHQRYLELREMLTADPEWDDGEIVDSHRVST